MGTSFTITSNFSHVHLWSMGATFSGITCTFVSLDLVAIGSREISKSLVFNSMWKYVAKLFKPC